MNKQQVIKELLDEIRSVTIADHWEIDQDRLLSYLPISREDYYRFVYSTRNQSNQAFVRDTYSKEHMDEIIALLEYSGLRDARQELERSGYFISQENLLRWHEFFLSVSMSRIQSHRIDDDLLDLSLSACRNPRDGFDFYAQDRLPVESLIAFAIPLFLKKRGIEDHHLSRQVLTDWIEQQIQRGLIDLDDLYESLYHNLHRRATKLGMLHWKSSFAHGAQSNSPGTGSRLLTDRQIQALQELGFDGKTLPRSSVIKKEFRSLIKKNHPDVNPQGADKTRRLNQAYAILMSEVYEIEGETT